MYLELPTLELPTQLKLQRLHPDAAIPEYANHGDVGLDLTSVDSGVLKPGKRGLFKSGWAMELTNSDYCLQVFPRSGLAIKHGVTVLNSPGLIDFNYRGDIGVILINHGQDDFIVFKGMRVAQLVISKVLKLNYIGDIVVVEKLSSPNSRGENGFGSTGV